MTDLVSQLKAGVIDDKQLFQELQKLQKDAAARKKQVATRCIDAAARRCR